MTDQTKSGEAHVKLAAPQFPVGVRSGGETYPLEYPHLCQIQAGDWRISYAVEHNRLAILVLEVLNAEGESSKDPARERLKQKMKVKLLDWPEGAPNRTLPPEEISKKLKIKWLDMAEEGGDAPPEAARPPSRIKLGAAGAAPQTKRGSRITLLESGETVIEDDPNDPPADDRKVTPLDEPSMQ